ncbi:hypothetical protein [Streptomyces sp. NBC_00140]|uniref:hypothetical protein n=1 Tax=Streptomyces sp. NBC_00140 TaxID=2975664 RepID=UPI002250C4F3|nr:hypothetical protein [Streptomyces sp. NBC_00140]MCX5327935.1 hypothetical protein [Streptomyces sp. NBC_00140]
MDVVQCGALVLAGVAMLAEVEAVPGEALGEGCGQRAQAQTDGGCKAAVGEQVGHGGQVRVEQGAGVLALLGAAV